MKQEHLFENYIKLERLGYIVQGKNVFIDVGHAAVCINLTFQGTERSHYQSSCLVLVGLQHVLSWAEG